MIRATPEDREESSSAGAAARPRRRLGRPLALALGAVLAAGALCIQAAADAPEPAAPEVPAPLGASAAELRQRFDASLRVAETERAGSVFDRIPTGDTPTPSEPPDPPASAPEQLRLARASKGAVQRVEYDLSDGRVYRVRWRLADRFERPVMDQVAQRLEQRLGSPRYDQTLRAELGSERSDLRRLGWTLEGRALEVRQLHPLTGGPVFLSLADVDAMQAIVDAQGVPLPQPETTGAWWRRPQQPPELPTAEERRELARAIDALVAQLAGSGAR